jgi:hypothetical protein
MGRLLALCLPFFGKQSCMGVLAVLSACQKSLCIVIAQCRRQEAAVAGMAVKAALAGLLLLAVVLGGEARRVLLVDSRSGSYLNTQRGIAKITKPALQGGVAALTGLLPAYELTENDSQQVGCFGTTLC